MNATYDVLSLPPEIGFQVAEEEMLNDSSYIWDSPLPNIQLNDDDHSMATWEYLVTQSAPVVEVKSAGLKMLDKFWIVLFSTMLSIAVLGNLIVIWIISCHRRMRTVTNYFLLNLAVADLAMASFNGAPNFVYMLRNDWLFGKMLCIINNFTAYWTVASCVATMTAISIDRWIAIVKPLEPRMTKATSWFTIIGIWIGSCIIASPALVFTQIVTDKRSSSTHCLIIWPDGLDPTNSKYEFGYNICLLVVTYLIPMTAMAICYGSMSWELWFTQVGEITQRQINSRIAKRKVVRMFIFVVVTFAVCWFPYHGYFIYMHIDKKVVFVKWIQHLYLSFFFLAMSQSAINPIIVISMNSRFRSYISNMFFRCSPSSCTENSGAHNIGYVAATPPLLRRYSQSCSRSRSNGTGDENTPGKIFHLNGPQRQNGMRKKNASTSNGHGHETINLNHKHVHGMITGNFSPRANSSRATYC